jgi:hypothetical protein
MNRVLIPAPHQRFDSGTITVNCPLSTVHCYNSTKVLSQGVERGVEPELDGERELAVGCGEGEPDGEPVLGAVLGLEWE